MSSNLSKMKNFLTLDREKWKLYIQKPSMESGVCRPVAKKLRKKSGVYYSLGRSILARPYPNQNVWLCLVFKDKPKNPPSVIQTLREEKKSGTLLQSLPKMLKNGAFLMLVFWYSVCCGLFTVLGTVLGEIITANFPVRLSNDMID